MEYLDFEERLIIKEFAERICYLAKDEEKLDSLKGSLDIEKRNRIEETIKGSKYYYSDGEKNAKGFKEVKIYCIGKSIVILKDDRKTIIDIISLKNFDLGIENFKKILEKINQEYMENFGKEEEEKERLSILENEFKNLGKWERVEKGKILEEMDLILSQDKELGKKTDMWKKLGISNSDKSMFCKRYNLFKELQESETFSGDKDWIKALENMTDANLKKITKEGLLTEEKEEMMLSLI